jgi:hypothetical protein
MIKCTVCLAENDDFAITCVSCKAFLQNRIPNLDLFEIGWKVLESPRKAFRSITLAEHKNYVLFLFTLFGVSLSFTGFWYFRLGTRFTNLIDLVPAAVGIGIVVGFLAALVIPAIHFAASKAVGGMSGFRGSLGILGYSLTPIAFSLFVVLPIELMTFGMFLFTSNPHPYTIKPVSYVFLVGFDAVIGLWSIILSVVGTKVAHQLSWFKSCIVIFTTLLVFFGAAILLLQQLNITGQL